MQTIKQSNLEWKVTEFNLDTNNHTVIGLFDTFKNACNCLYNIEYEIVHTFHIQKYKCTISKVNESYIGGIYMFDKIIYLDPNSSQEIIGNRTKWKTKKEIIIQIGQYINTITLT